MWSGSCASGLGADPTFGEMEDEDEAEGRFLQGVEEKGGEVGVLFWLWKGVSSKCGGEER